MKPLLSLSSFVVLMLSWLIYVPTATAAKLKASDGQTYTDSIKLKSYKRDGDIYDTIIGRVLFKTSLAAPMVVLTETDELTEWVHSSVEASVVNEVSAADKTLYFVFSAPLGIEDRDAYMRFSGQRSSDNIFTMSLEQDYSYPSNDNAVRMSNVKGHFRMEELENQLVAVEFELHINPNLRPIFAANANTKSVVKNTLENLRERLEDKRDVSAIPDQLAAALGI
ncbi:hypothetical protein CS022_17665 [Veronia nyctiphanis]|uniref:Uncharacterized protein n=1 Tax=Veronia nyctiphanis TaxID=1278244 RepID=A0A4Q0YSM0_9GAMM|nr:hypothetical protein [Veronia nyctiphanis]RXJ72099.1 hypothetical protein CS022_17665 [Veronia nyctiphanis]